MKTYPKSTNNRANTRLKKPNEVPKTKIWRKDLATNSMNQLTQCHCETIHKEMP